MNFKTIASAPGKIILSGEHAVVFGYPALVTACNLRARVGIEKSKDNLNIFPDTAREIVLRTLNNSQKILVKKNRDININLESDIPIGSGMGSSAAVAVCVAAAFLKFNTGETDLEKINKIAYETEKLYHINSSGVDPAISTYGGFLWYRKETDKLKTFIKIKPLKKIPDIFLVNTGKPKENTGDMVKIVSEKHSKNTHKIERILLNIEKVTRGFMKYFLKEETTIFGDLIKENERYLEELGVVSESAKNLIRKIEKYGGAAKISGAGGLKGNSGMLFIHHPDGVKFLKFAKENNLDVVPAKFSAKGVKIEKS